MQVSKHASQIDMQRSIVMIDCHFNEYDYGHPYASPSSLSSQGTGFVIEEGIITNAHVVANASDVEIQFANRTERYPAKVIAIAHDCDLALLAVTDPNFKKEAEPLKLGKGMKRRDNLVVYGFPIGGDEVSVTEGIASRPVMDTYAHSHLFQLSWQIDAAINYGNSGGPVVHQNEVVGITHQGRDDAQNIGYCIPVNLLKRFLHDIKLQGYYRGTPYLGIETQELQNRALREHFGMIENKLGIRVQRIHTTANVSPLQVDDIILKMSSYDIYSDETILFEGNRIPYQYAYTRMLMGEKLPLTILRDKINMDIEITLDQQISDIYLKHSKEFDVKPNYVFYGGLLFQPLTENYLEDGFDQKREELPDSIATLPYIKKTKPKEEAVIMNTVFRCDGFRGLDVLSDIRLIQVNDHIITNLKDLYNYLFEAPHHFTQYKFIFESGEIIIAPKMSIAAQKDLLKEYEIHKPFQLPD